MCSLSSTERKRTRRWLPRTEKNCSDLKNTAAPLKTLSFGHVQNLAFGWTSPSLGFRLSSRRSVSHELAAPIGKVASPGASWLQTGRRRCSRSRVLSSDELDNVPFCRTVALDVSLGHRKRGMSSHLLHVAERSTRLRDFLRNGSDESPSA
jgi:hypothetical protein